MFDHPAYMKTTNDVASQKPGFAVLPVGAFEQHGPHLPLATDAMISTFYAAELATAFGGLALPPVTISCSQEHAGFAGSAWITSQTLSQMVGDIYASLMHSGICKLVLVNGHGGNYVLSHVAQELNLSGPNVLLLFQKQHLAAAAHAAGLTTTPHGDMHAGEYETSLMLHIKKDAVKTDMLQNHQADERPLLHLEGMAHYTQTGVIGYPELATAEKGAMFSSAVIQAAKADMTGFLNNSR